MKLNLWLRVVMASILGTVISLFIYFGLPINKWMSAGVGLVVGIFSSLMFFDAQQVIEVFGNIKRMFKKCIKEINEMDVSKERHDLEVMDSFFDYVAGRFKAFFVFVFSVRLIKFLIGLGYRVVIVYFTYKFVVKNEFLNVWYSKPILIPVMTIGVIYIVVLLMGLLDSLDEDLFSSCKKEFEFYESFFSAESIIWTFSFKMMFFILLLAILLAIFVPLFIVLLPFYFFLEIKKKSNLLLVAVSILIGSIVGWFFPTESINIAFMAGISSAVITVVMAFAVRFFFEDIDVWCPFKLFTLIINRKSIISP